MSPTMKPSSLEAPHPAAVPSASRSVPGATDATHSTAAAAVPTTITTLSFLASRPTTLMMSQHSNNNQTQRFVVNTDTAAKAHQKAMQDLAKEALRLARETLAKQQQQGTFGMVSTHAVPQESICSSAIRSDSFSSTVSSSLPGTIYTPIAPISIAQSPPNPRSGAASLPILTPSAGSPPKLPATELSAVVGNISATPSSSMVVLPRLNKFVRRLHDMLRAEQNKGIVEWRRGLLVLHNTHAFAKRILPAYFNTRNFKTFRRQLNYYGFVHVRSFSTTGASTTALWVHRGIAQEQAGGNMDEHDFTAVLQLKRVDPPTDAAKTAEGRRVRKEQALHTVEDDLGVNAKTLQMDHIRNLALLGSSAVGAASEDEEMEGSHVGADGTMPQTTLANVGSFNVADIATCPALWKPWLPQAASTTQVSLAKNTLTGTTPRTTAPPFSFAGVLPVPSEIHYATLAFQSDAATRVQSSTQAGCTPLVTLAPAYKDNVTQDTYVNAPAAQTCSSSASAVISSDGEESSNHEDVETVYRTIDDVTSRTNHALSAPTPLSPPPVLSTTTTTWPLRSTSVRPILATTTASSTADSVTNAAASLLLLLSKSS